MENLRTLQDVVEDVLENSYASRNSDYNLYYHVLKRKCPDVLNRGLGEVLLYKSRLGIPSFESVGRARRKICERRPELRGTANVEAGRAMNEEEFKKYARGGIYG